LFVQFQLLDLKISIRRVIIGKPSRYGSDTTPLYPVVCRNGHMTYSSPLFVEFVHHHSKSEQILSITKRCGRIPIMVGSCLCHLAHLTPEEKVQLKEEANETGGYFIVNGNERLIRFVIQQRCNHPIALTKARFSERDLFFSDSAIFMRCAKKDGTSTLNILFYTQDRQCAFRVLINRQEVFVNFWTLLRALMPDIPAALVKKKLFEATFQDTMSNVNASQKSVLGFIEIDQLWEEFMNQETLFCDVDAYENRYLHQLGKQYWDLVSSRIKPDALYEDAGRYVIDQYILVHCDTWTSKFEILILLYQKLILLVRGEISVRNCFKIFYVTIALF
jgi:DNA-directed RNA polymerase I subunit RPA2